MIRLLAIDIDGTLLDSQGRLPDAHRDALFDTARRGVEIALVTGRSFDFSRSIVERLPLLPLTLVVSNGALVKSTTGATHMRRLLSRETALDVLAHTRAYEDSVALVFDRPDQTQVLYERMDWTHPRRRGYYEKHKAFIAEAAPLAATLTEDPVQVMFNGGVEPMRALVGVLGALPGADRFSVAVTEYERRDFSMVDVNAAGCSKGSTLARWAEERGLTREEVMAVGDNLNDVDMLEFAGTPVVMGNATDALKARGWHVTGTNDEGGLAAAIDEFLRT